MLTSEMIGNRIKYYRELAGITQKELAGKVGAHENSIVRYEKGTRKPDAVVISKICEALSIPPTLILGVCDTNKLVRIGELVMEIYHIINEINGE